MKNPIKIWRELKDIFLKYIDSGLHFNDDRFKKERRSLYDTSGAICQPPIIELVAQYKGMSTIKEVCLKNHIDSDFVEFTKCGLFPDSDGVEKKLYQHQEDALMYAINQRKHIVATTGTGSGKTECFLLPIISDLISESKTWNKSRHRAVRSLILYPLNALAEDQMVRLRKSLNSKNKNKTGARDWLDKNRHGQRFYFGRYTGLTPVSGRKLKNRKRFNKAKEHHCIDWEAAQKMYEETGNEELLYHIPCMDEDSAEMWDRFSMQDTPPDILITNYSMLNIILMREQELSIFEDTKEWLSEDSSRIFHLVIDEMHTYRGTAGTEVAYLIRILLDKLGLSPDSDQVQFIASSASMQKNKRTKEYLCNFFGVNKKKDDYKFKLLSNPPFLAVNKPQIQLPLKDLTQLAINIKEGGFETAFEVFKQNTGCKTPKQAIEKFRILDWLKYSMQDNDGHLKALKDVEISTKLFPGSKDNLEALEALISIVCYGKSEAGVAIQPIRAHFFFRNVDGLWGCSKPDCQALELEFKWHKRRIGKLFRTPRAFCECGSKVLEIIICRECGEIFLGGHLFNDSGKELLFIDNPDFSQKNNYCVLWPGKTVNRELQNKTLWKNYIFDPVDGELIRTRGETATFIPDQNYPIQFPNRCPNCDISYRIQDSHSLSPLSKHNTGVQKVNQVMADALIRTMKQAKNKSAKLVLFSDSRQAAAKLSAGIELDHYRDVLRQFVLNSLESEDKNKTLLKKYRITSSALTDEEKEKINKLRSGNPFYNRIMSKIGYERDGLLSTEEIQELNQFFNTKSLTEIQMIKEKVWKKIATIGINPAGPAPSLTTRENSDWKNLFIWNEGNVERADIGSGNRFFQDIITKCDREQLITIFAHKKKSFESLKLGYITANLQDAECVNRNETPFIIN